MLPFKKYWIWQVWKMHMDTLQIFKRYNIFCNTVWARGRGVSCVLYPKSKPSFFLSLNLRVDIRVWYIVYLTVSKHPTKGMLQTDTFIYHRALRGLDGWWPFYTIFPFLEEELKIYIRCGKIFFKSEILIFTK